MIKSLRIALLIVAVCITAKLSAKKDSARKQGFSIACINAGISFPGSQVGDLPGVTLGCMVQFAIDNDFGAEGLFSFNRNKVDNSLYTHLLTNTNAGYNSEWLLGGFYYNVHIKSPILNFHMLTGIMYMSCPEIKWYTYDQSPEGWGSDTTHVMAANMSALAFNIGLSFLCTPGDKMSVLFSLDYYTAYKTKAITGTESGAGSSVISPYQTTYSSSISSLRVNLICCSIGIAYRLTK